MTDTGLHRPNNEDTVFVSSELGLCLVADGMGGARAGEMASHLAVETVAQYVSNTTLRDQSCLERAFVAANRRVFDEAARSSDCDGMGTTLVGFLETGEGVCVANVGDSRAYLFSGQRLQLLTSDHSWVNEVGRPLGLEDDEIRRHPLRNALTRAVGVGLEVQISTQLVQPPDGSLILLSSDGLHGVVPFEKIQSILCLPESLKARGRRLIEAARDAGGPDNITAALAAF